MPILPDSAKDIVLPNMIPVKQLFPDQKIDDVFEATIKEIQSEKSMYSLKPGANVAVLVGSRGISGLKEVVKATIEQLIELRAKPFIIPAMGSHGGGIATEQQKIIEGYGVTEEYMGVPICSSMDVVKIGETSAGVPVYIDKLASNADYIIPIVRIKPHTDFDGPIESGFCKMLSIGIGKHHGCSRLHQEGFSEFPHLIPEVASVVLKKKKIPFGIAIIENAHEHVHTIRLVPGENILKEEPELLKLSKSLMPKLCFDHIDVLVVEQIGKDVAGTGMDPNITGRSSAGTSPYFRPTITRIVILDLSEGTHGNANGVGYADFITKKVFEKIDFESTYANGIAAGAPGACNIPVILDTEEEALLAAIQTCPKIDVNKAKVVRIKDTLHLIDIKVSESLLPYCLSNDSFMV